MKRAVGGFLGWMVSMRAFAGWKPAFPGVRGLEPRVPFLAFREVFQRMFAEGEGAALGSALWKLPPAP